MSARALLAGCGNRDCGDDAAGLLAIESIRGTLPAGVAAIEAGLDLLPLLDRWGDYERIVFIDAVSTRSPPGTVHFWTRASLPAEIESERCSSHGFGLTSLLRLAEALGCAHPEIFVVGVEGTSFEPGAPITPAVAAAIGRAAQLSLQAATA